MFTLNESNLDRAIRIIVGLFLLLVTSLLFGVWQWIFGVAATYLIITGLAGVDLFYRAIGVNTLEG
jgi:uncharacterized membrane protein